MVSVFKKHVRYLEDRLGAFVSLDTKSRNPGYHLALELDLTTRVVQQRQHAYSWQQEEDGSGSARSFSSNVDSSLPQPAAATSLLQYTDFVGSELMSEDQQAEVLLEQPAVPVARLPTAATAAAELFFPQHAADLDDSSSLDTTYFETDSLFGEQFQSTKSTLRSLDDVQDSHAGESVNVLYSTTGQAHATDYTLQLVYQQYQQQIEQRRRARAARGSTNDDDASQTTAATWASTEVTALSRDHVMVCLDFLKGTCPKFDCARAHPGLRDSATIDIMRNETGAKLPFTRLCQKELFGNCEDGKKCTLYHVYRRPPTEQIIAKLYPKTDGVQSRLYPSGARFRGNVKNRKFSGHGVISYANGDVFMGDWENGQRNGLGIFRSADGREVRILAVASVDNGEQCLVAHAYNCCV